MANVCAQQSTSSTSSSKNDKYDPYGRNVVDVDHNLYSRQIGTFGIETMGRLVQMDVLICGLRGTGVEI